MAFSVPIAELALKFLPRIISYVAKQYVIDVDLAKGNNPTISVFYDTASIRYKLLLKTHGSPKHARKTVRFPQVKTLGEIIKKAVSPVTLGEIEGLKLKFCTDEMPANTDVEMFVDFDVRVDVKRLVTMKFTNSLTSITSGSPEIEVLATSNCDFPLEQIRLEVDKSPDYNVDDAKVEILDRTSHNWLADIEPKSVTKGDDKIKWVTRFGPHDSLLFKVIAVAN